jgi:hypothetical protein
VLLVAGMVGWFAADYMAKLNGMGQGLSDAFSIEPQPSEGKPVNETQSICLCSYRNKGDLVHSWGAPYGEVVARDDASQAKLGPDIFWEYCQTAGMPPPDTSTAAGSFTNRVLLSFCVQVFDMHIAPPVSSVQWSRDSFNSTRLAEARSK